MDCVRIGLLFVDGDVDSQGDGRGGGRAEEEVVTGRERYGWERLGWRFYKGKLAKKTLWCGQSLLASQKDALLTFAAAAHHLPDTYLQL